MDANDQMKIQGSKSLKSIPMELLLPHERQADINHGQTLRHLNRRGGLSGREALCILKDKRYFQIQISEQEAERILLEFVANRPLTDQQLAVLAAVDRTKKRGEKILRSITPTGQSLIGLVNQAEPALRPEKGEHRRKPDIDEMCYAFGLYEMILERQ